VGLKIVRWDSFQTESEALNVAALADAVFEKSPAIAAVATANPVKSFVFMVSLR
jgi:hypothetical protein